MPLAEDLTEPVLSYTPFFWQLYTYGIKKYYTWGDLYEKIIIEYPDEWYTDMTPANTVEASFYYKTNSFSYSSVRIYAAPNFNSELSLVDKWKDEIIRFGGFPAEISLGELIRIIKMDEFRRTMYLAAYGHKMAD
jgi:hypothetical protein